MKPYFFNLISLLLTLTLSGSGFAQTSRSNSAPLILAHYMPWYQAKPTSERWGWHWTMNAYDPDRSVGQTREIASHLYPLVGPYDSNDADILEYHLLLMKIAGIDGVIVDWYGLQDANDYPILHRNTKHLVEWASRLGLKIVVCYEDQTIPKLVAAGKIKKTEQVEHAIGEIQWLNDHWFGLESYVRQDDRPVLLSFGRQGLTDDEWTRCLQNLDCTVAYYSQQEARVGATGVFDWPLPKQGIKATEAFHRQARQRGRVAQSIPVAYPRFIDIYAEAGVHDSWGRIPDDGGATFRSSLDQALETGAPLIQLATWNDWGEGTAIEPSREYGYRDLEYLQTRRRAVIDSAFTNQSADLELPGRLLNLRRLQGPKPADFTTRLNWISQQLADGDTDQARSEIAYWEKQLSGRLP